MRSWRDGSSTPFGLSLRVPIHFGFVGWNSWVAMEISHDVWGWYGLMVFSTGQEMDPFWGPELGRFLEIEMNQDQSQPIFVFSSMALSDLKGPKRRLFGICWGLTVPCRPQRTGKGPFGGNAWRGETTEITEHSTWFGWGVFGALQRARLAFTQPYCFYLKYILFFNVCSKCLRYLERNQVVTRCGPVNAKWGLFEECSTFLIADLKKHLLKNFSIWDWFKKKPPRYQGTTRFLGNIFLFTTRSKGRPKPLRHTNEYSMNPFAPATKTMVWRKMVSNEYCNKST